LPAFAWQAIFC